jgi:hypothetical protein
MKDATRQTARSPLESGDAIERPGDTAFSLSRACRLPL